MMRIITVKQQRDQPIIKYTHNPAQADMITDQVSSYLIFFLEIDSTTTTVDHEDTHRSVVAI